MKPQIEGMIEKVPLGFAIHEVFFDEKGEPEDFLVIAANNTFIENSAFTREALVGKRITSVIPSIREGQRDWIHFYGEIVKTGVPKEIRQAYQSRDRIFRVTGHSHQAPYFTIVLQDVTVFERELEQRQVLLRALRPILMEVDARHKILEVWATEELGSFTSLVGKDLQEVVGVYAEDFLRAIGQAEQKGIPEELEHGCFFSEEQKFFRTEVYCIRPHKDSLRYLLVIHDVTKEKEKEQGILTKKRELELFFTVNLDLMCIQDHKGHFLKVNKAWEEVLGISTEELLKKSTRDLVHPEDFGATQALMNELKGQKRVFDHVNRYRKSDGSYRYLEWRAAPFDDKTYSSCRDITASIKERLDLTKLLKDTEDYVQYAEEELDPYKIAEDLRSLSGGLFVSFSKRVPEENCYVFIGVAGDKEKIAYVDKQLGFSLIGSMWEAPELTLKDYREGSALILDLSVVTGTRMVREEGRVLQNLLGIQSILILPIFFEEDLLGYFTVFLKEKKAPSNLSLLQVFARQVGLIIARNDSRTRVFEERNRYERLIQNAREALFLLSAQDLRILHRNQAGEDILGYKECLYEDNQAMLPLIFHREDQEAVLRMQERILKGESNKENIVLGWITNDNDVAYMEHTFIPVKNSEGEILLLESLGRDVTEARRLKEELFARDQLLRNLSQQVPGVLYQYQVFPDGRRSFPYCSNKAEEIFSLSTEEVVADSAKVFSLIDPLHMGRLKDFERKGDFFWQNEFRICLPHGEKRLLHGDAYSEELSDGSVLWHGYISDVTDCRELEEELAVRLQAEQLLTAISLCFVQTETDFSQSIERALELLAKFFPLQRACLFLCVDHKETLEIEAEYVEAGVVSAYLGGVGELGSLPWWERVLSEAELVVLPDLFLLKEEEQDQIRVLLPGESRSLWIAPLGEKGKTGCITLESFPEMSFFGPDLSILLSVVGELFCSLLERRQVEHTIAHYALELESRELELESLYNKLDLEVVKAREFHEQVRQKTLPKMDTFACASAYKPATRIGGDLYGVIKKRGKLILYLSDVTGHGVDGALLSAFVKNTMNGYVSLCKEDMLTPKKMATHLSLRMREEDYPLDYAIALYIGVLHVSTGELIYTAAGLQTPPCMVTAEGTMEYLVSYGLPLTNSVDHEDLDLEEQAITIPPNARVVFSTDGLMDQEVAGEFYQKRLESFLISHRDLPCQVLADGILKDFHVYLGSNPQEDDITFLVLGSGENVVIRQVFQTTFSALEKIREIVQASFADYTEREDLLFAVHELAANAMEHGNKLDPRKTLRLEISVSSSSIIATIEDEGRGFNWRQREKQELDFFGESDRGRGMLMISLMGGTLIYNEEGNRVSVLLPRENQGAV